MGKRKKGKGRKRRQAMTRRDPSAKQERRDAAGAEDEADENDDDLDDDEDDRDDDDDDRDDDDSEAGDDADDADDDDDDDDRRRAADSDAGDPDEFDDEEQRAADVDDHKYLDGASWANAFVAIDRRWTWLETRLMFVGLMALVLVLVLWITIRGLNQPLENSNASGTVFRALAGATVLGTIARLATRKLADTLRTRITGAVIVVGLLIAPLWRGVGIEYANQLNAFLEEGSIFTLMGGLKGVSTRLTMWVALVGASLATAMGTHINIDVVLRVVPKRFRRALLVAGAVATTIVCVLTAWGFFDHIAVAELGADTKYQDANGTPRAATDDEKIDLVMEEAGEHFFLFRKQLVLDFGGFAQVITGEPWHEGRMTGAEWNAYLRDAGFVERHGEEEMKIFYAPEESANESWRPFVVSPGRSTRGVMLHSLDLLWPIGFLMIGIRFLLRGVLLASGHSPLTVEGEAEDDDGAKGKEQAEPKKEAEPKEKAEPKGEPEADESDEGESEDDEPADESDADAADDDEEDD